MVSNRVLVPFLVAAVLLVDVGFVLVVVPRAFMRPCHDGAPEDHGGGGSSPAPSPGPAAACDAAVCRLRVSLPVLGVILFVVGFLVGWAAYSCYSWLADGENQQEDATGAAKKAGCVVAIAADPEDGTGAAGSNK